MNVTWGLDIDFALIFGRSIPKVYHKPNKDNGKAREIQPVRRIVLSYKRLIKELRKRNVNTYVEEEACWSGWSDAVNISRNSGERCLGKAYQTADRKSR